MTDNVVFSLAVVLVVVVLVVVGVVSALGIWRIRHPQGDDHDRGPR